MISFAYLDIKIITKEVYDNNEQSGPNWTNRAGTFLEQSRAFLDSYLSRWDRGGNEDRIDDDTLDDCTSGATSGEDVWGTPTSGENDEIQMFNSDQTNSVCNLKDIKKYFEYSIVFFTFSHQLNRRLH